MAILEDTLNNFISPELAAWRAKPATVDTSFPPNLAEKTQMLLQGDPSITTIRSAGVDNVNEGARLRGSNSQATLDASGRVTLSGSGSPSSSSSTVSANSFDLTQTNLDIENATTSRDKLNIAQVAIGKLNSYKATKEAEAIAQANEKFGVTQLEQTIQQSMAADMLSPNNPAKVIGPKTIQLQQQLQQAKSYATQYATQSLTTDPIHAGIMAQGQFLIQKAGSEASKMMDKEDTAVAKAQIIAESTPKEVIDNYDTMFPEIKGMPVDRKLVYLAKHQDKEAVEVAQVANKPEVLKSFLTGTPAQQTAVKTFLSNKAGDDNELRTKALKEVGEYQGYLGSPEKAINELFLDPAKSKDKEAALANLALLKQDPSANKADIHRLSLAYADDLMKIKAEKNFMDTSMWTPASKAMLISSPATSGIMAQVTARGEQPTMANIMMAMSRLTSPAELSAAKTFIAQVGAAESAKSNSNTLWPATNVEDFYKKLEQTTMVSVLHRNDEATLSSSIKGIWDVSAFGLQQATAGLLIPFGYVGSGAAAVLETPFSQIGTGVLGRIHSSAKEAAKSAVGEPVLKKRSNN